MRIKIAICDDEKIIRKELKQIVESYPYLLEEKPEICCYQMGTELLEVARVSKFEIVFMDIELEPGEGKKTGFDYAAEIKNLCPHTLIVYVTGYDRYITSAVYAEPFSYISKPIQKERVHMVIDRAIKRIILMAASTQYFFNTGKMRVRIDLNDVLYVMAHYKKIIVKTQEGEIEFWGKLDEVYQEIDSFYNYFVPINKSTLVNFKHVDRFKKRRIMMKGIILPISRKYENECLKKMIYLAKQHGLIMSV